MKIGVVSDTHSMDMPKEMLKAFKSVDFIIHAGDFCDKDDVTALEKIKDVKAVHGNMDPAEIRDRFPRKQIIDCHDKKIGVFHGEGPAATILKSVQSEFKEDAVDVIIFGHSHQPFNEKINDVLYFNPGSPTDTITAPYLSYGILNVSDKKVEGKIIQVKD